MKTYILANLKNHLPLKPYLMTIQTKYGLYIASYKAEFFLLLKVLCMHISYSSAE